MDGTSPGRYFATAPRGTEPLLADELEALGIAPCDPLPGAVRFGRSLEDAYRACLASRIARRIFLPLAEIEVPDAEALYAEVHRIEWAEHLGPEATFAVGVTGSSPAGPSRFVALKTKDAIVDRLRADLGARPNVDTKAPDLRVHVHLEGTSASVAIELASSGVGERAEVLAEGLAAAALRAAGWTPETTPLFDPLAGSGILLAEAVAVAFDVAPGLDAARRRFGVEAWRGHEAGLWGRLSAEAHQRRRAARHRAPRLGGAVASKKDRRTILQRLRAAGLADAAQVDVHELRDVEAPPGDPGLVVTQAPGGLSPGRQTGELAELGPLYELLGDVLKRQFPGWTAWVQCASPALARRVGLRPAQRLVWDIGWADEEALAYRLLEIPISSAPVRGEEGPGWRRPSPEAGGLAKRLRKNLRRLGPWAKRHGIDAYRIYDTDMPRYNLAIDLYGSAVRVEEYAAPRKVAAREAEHHLNDALRVVSEVLEVEPKEIFLRVRRRRRQQHERRGMSQHTHEVREGDLRFEVNLEDYLDTGLFLDDRLLRRRIRDGASGRHFLNLFAYTCTASVAAARGGARSTTSVDLSRTYLGWGRRNFDLNSLVPGEAHRFVQANVREWLARPDRSRQEFDLIFVAPPTASRSKGMRGDFDIQRDHVELLASCARLLAPQGEILFTTNLRSFTLDAAELKGSTSAGFEVHEITEEITPRDFSRRPRLRAWSLGAKALGRERGDS